MPATGRRRTPPASRWRGRPGAVVLGKTVTTEFAMRAPGPTTNPHAPTHTPGGSSSGSAAAVADSHGAGRLRHPDRRLGDPAGVLLRRRRLQAEPRHDQPHRRQAARRELRHRRPVRAQRRGRGPGQRGARGRGARAPSSSRSGPTGSACAARPSGGRPRMPAGLRSRRPPRCSPAPASRSRRWPCRRLRRLQRAAVDRAALRGVPHLRLRAHRARGPARAGHAARSSRPAAGSRGATTSLPRPRIRECRGLIAEVFGSVDLLLAPSAPGEAPRGLGEHRRGDLQPALDRPPDAVPQPAGPHRPERPAGRRADGRLRATTIVRLLCWSRWLEPRLARG